MTQSKQTNRKRSGQSGFAIIEVMIAIVILSVGMCAVIGKLWLSDHGNRVGAGRLDRPAESAGCPGEHLHRPQQPAASFLRRSKTSPTAESSWPAPNLALCAGPVYGIVGVQGDTSPCITASGATCPNGGVECTVLPGPDGVLGSGTDETFSLSNFTRTIAFNPVNLPVARAAESTQTSSASP